MKPTWKRVGGEIIITFAAQTYRLGWRDVDIAAALYQSLMADHQKRRVGVIRCIKTTDTPAFDRGFNDKGFHRGRVIRATQHRIPVELNIYLGNHGKRKNAELLLSIGDLHFRFVQADVAEVFDGEADEEMEQNPGITLTAMGASG